MDQESTSRRIPWLSAWQKTIVSVCLLLSLLVLLLVLQPPSTAGRHFQLPQLHGLTSGAALLSDIANQTLGFERIFCIGLASRTDHRDAVELAAASTNLTLDWIDGVTQVDNKSLPVGNGQRLGSPGVSSWRAHLNALNLIVRNNISSALILEDDADWDVRIKQQMHDFALSSRALLQPVDANASPEKEYSYQPLLFDDLPPTQPPSRNVYGDDWDVLWLGHCGMTRPRASSGADVSLPLSYVAHVDDETVPEPRYLRDFRGNGDGYLSGTNFANHTRLVYHPQNGFCSAAYAVTQRGARNLLWYAGVRAFDDWFDKLLPNFCEGRSLDGLKQPRCITVQPQLFDQHKPRGDKSKESDIFPGGDGYREKAETATIRWSTRLNLPKLLNGESDYIDQWPDSGA